MLSDTSKSWSQRQFDRYASERFWKSVPFFLLLALFANAAGYGVWIIESSWTVLSNHHRFFTVFVLVTSPMLLYGAVQQQRYIRQLGLPTEAARRILALTFMITAWSYALLGIALRLVLRTLLQSR